jgi:hypothetical protein
MALRLITTLLFLTTLGLSSACNATADPPAPSPTDPSAPGSTRPFPDMSNYSAVNPDEYKWETDNPGRPTKLTTYGFNTPDGVRCTFGQSSSASCAGINLPGIPPAVCDPVQRVFRYNTISTSQGVQQWPQSRPTCTSNPSRGKVLPPFHTLTVYGVTCGVDDKGTTACKDPQGRGFVLSPSWSGWLPKV